MVDGGHEPPSDDGALAAWLADGAGRLLLELRERFGFEDPDALRQAGDRHSHELLMTALRRWRPDDAVLSEEGNAPTKPRLTAERVWIVDPLDGTQEFGEPGRTDWAVHVALWTRERGLCAGAVALPALGRVYSTAAPPARPPSRPDRRLRLVVSRSRPPGFAADLAEALDAELIPMGSAGAKVCAVLAGAADGYVHAGGQYEWDSAAPVAVALAAGFVASRANGGALTYNQPDPTLPDLVVCQPEIAAPLFAELTHLLGGDAGAVVPDQSMTWSRA